MRRLFGVLALMLGIAGVLACVAGAYGVRRVEVRIERTSDAAFDMVDKGLTAVQNRIPAVRVRVQQARITADDVGAAVKRWASAETRERVVSSLEIEPRASALSNLLQAADARLEASADGLQTIHQLLDLTEGPGDVAKIAATGRAQDVIAAVRSKIQEAGALVEEVRTFAADGGGPVENRLAHVTKTIARIALTLSDVDGSLEQVSGRLTEIRREAQERRDRRSRQIAIGALAACAVLIWIALAMVALGWWGLFITRAAAR